MNLPNIEVRLEDENIRLNRNQIASLFARDIKTIGKRVNNVFKDGELEKGVVFAHFAQPLNMMLSRVKHKHL